MANARLILGSPLLALGFLACAAGESQAPAAQAEVADGGGAAAADAGHSAEIDAVPVDDTAHDSDAGSISDAGPALDTASILDTVPGVDTAPGADAPADSGAGGIGQPCNANGQAGVCEGVTLCQGSAIPGFCPGPADVQCCVPKSTACDPSAAPLPNGGVTTPAGAAGCPAGMAKVEGFCIDRWEAHLQVQTPQGDFKEWSPYVNPGSQVVRAVSAPGSVPQGHLSGIQASAACKLSGKRLCKDSEWLRACRGPSNWTYPYGNALTLGKCNDHRSIHPAVELYGTSASWIYSKLNNACLNQLPKSLATTGSYAGCVSAEGVFDLMGNLHEWTADPAGTFRGGFYVDTKLNGPGCLYVTTAHDSGHADYSTGFRCCADPK